MCDIDICGLEEYLVTYGAWVRKGKCCWLRRCFVHMHASVCHICVGALQKPESHRIVVTGGYEPLGVGVGTKLSSSKRAASTLIL